MTNRIDRLESRGLVHRQPDPRDRRGVRVVLTDSGRRAVDDAMSDLLRREHELLEILSPHDRADLSALLRRLVEQFDATS
jgi:DNA-binding MarR family transcriptional regulator